MAKRDTKKNFFKMRLCLAIAIFLMGSLIFSSSYSKGKYDTFTNCLKEEGVVFYGTLNCPICKLQKELFKESMNKLDYVECSLNKRRCAKEGVTEYPSWKINGSIYTSELSLIDIADLSGCNLVEDL